MACYVGWWVSLLSGCLLLWQVIYGFNKIFHHLFWSCHKIILYLISSLLWKLLRHDDKYSRTNQAGRWALRRTLAQKMMSRCNWQTPWEQLWKLCIVGGRKQGRCWHSCLATDRPCSSQGWAEMLVLPLWEKTRQVLDYKITVAFWRNIKDILPSSAFQYCCAVLL